MYLTELGIVTEVNVLYSKALGAIALTDSSKTKFVVHALPSNAVPVASTL
jgi:hypothetical protein